MIYTETETPQPTLSPTVRLSQRLPLPGRGRRRTGSVSYSRTSHEVELMLIRPDIRSDIYSVGATLYHLISGICPAENAETVVPLSGPAYSPQTLR